MGTIARLGNVLSANVNALLERAEDPEKMLAALIREMEDALGEARAAAAELIRDRKVFERRLEDLKAQHQAWSERAEHAVARGSDDLARSAIASKVRLAEERRRCEAALAEAADSVARVDADVVRLEHRLAEARRRQQQMNQRPVQIQAIKRYASPADRKLSQVMARFERLEAQIDHLEARVEAFDLGPRPEPAADPGDPAVEEELERLRARVARAETT